jgi:hypothetical protein
VVRGGNRSLDVERSGDAMIAGRVVALYPDEEYGIVRDERGHRWRFFQCSTEATFRFLRRGQRVMFRIAGTHHECIAENLQPVDAAAEEECGGYAC